MMANRTRGAGGDLKLNHTLVESPTHWRVRQQPRKKKRSFDFPPAGGVWGGMRAGFAPNAWRKTEKGYSKKR
jgi:hypothetical protein